MTVLKSFNKIKISVALCDEHLFLISTDSATFLLFLLIWKLLAIILNYNNQVSVFCLELRHWLSCHTNILTSWFHLNDSSFSRKDQFTLGPSIKTCKWFIISILLEASKKFAMMSSAVE